MVRFGMFPPVNSTRAGHSVDDSITTIILPFIVTLMVESV